MFNEWDISGEVFVRSKIKEVIREEKMEKMKAREKSEINVELLIVEWKKH